MFLHFLKNWANRYLGSEETIVVFLLLAGVFTLIYFFSATLMPVLIALILSFVLVPLTQKIESFGVSSTLAVSIVMALFVGLLATALVFIIPLLTQQLQTLLLNIPSIIAAAKAWTLAIQQLYPVVPWELLQQGFESFRDSIINFGKSIINTSLSSITSIASISMYVIIVPILMFFMLQDRHTLIRQIKHVLPPENSLMIDLWQQMRRMIRLYLQNKLVEFVIVTAGTWLVLGAFTLQYALLLSVVTGIAVIIPYVGTLIAFVPVVLVGFAQWGASATLLYCCFAYLAIQALDAYIVVPLLFSDSMNLRPLWVLLALLLFSSIWGVWGIVLAIPLATLIKVLISSWPVVNINLENQ